MTSPQHWTENQRRQQICELLRNKGIICQTYLLTGSCPRSPMCPYMHIRNGEVRMLPWSVCSFFNNGVCLRDNCSYFHGSQEQLDKLRASGAKVYRPQDYMKIASPPVDCLDENSDVLRNSESQNSLTSVQQPSELLSVASLPLQLPLQIHFNEATSSILTKEQINSLQESPLVNWELNLSSQQQKEEKQQKSEQEEHPLININSSLQHYLPQTKHTNTISAPALVSNVAPVNASCTENALYLTQNNTLPLSSHDNILWHANNSNNSTNINNNENNSNNSIKINSESNRQTQLLLSNSLLESPKLESCNNLNNIAIMQSNLTSNNQINTIPIACQISPTLQPSLPSIQPVQYRYLHSFNALQSNAEPTSTQSSPTITLLTSIPQTNSLTLPVISTPTQLISQEIKQENNQPLYNQHIMEQQKIFISQDQLEYLRREQFKKQKEEQIQFQHQQQPQCYEQLQAKSPQTFQLYFMTNNQATENKSFYSTTKN